MNFFSNILKNCTSFKNSISTTKRHNITSSSRQETQSHQICFLRKKWQSSFIERNTQSQQDRQKTPTKNLQREWTPAFGARISGTYQCELWLVNDYSNNPKYICVERWCSASPKFLDWQIKYKLEDMVFSNYLPIADHTWLSCGMLL